MLSVRAATAQTDSMLLNSTAGEQEVSMNSSGNTTNASSSLNGTGEAVVISDIHPAFENLIIVLYVLVIVLALVGNGCVIYLVLSQRQMRNVTNYFIASLATSDALMALVCIPTTFISNVLVDTWPFPAWMCPFATYIQVVVVFQNAFTFVAISLERYVAIMYPFRRRLSRCQCFMIIALTWFMSLGTPLPTAIVSRLQEMKTDDPNVTHSFCLEAWPLEGQRFSYSITIMVLQYFVPLAVLTYTYIRIVVVVWLKDAPPHGRMGGVSGPADGGRPMFGQQDSNLSSAGFQGRAGGGGGGGQYVDPRKRIIKMMMTVVGIYAVCWLPIHIITILGDTNPDIWELPAMRYIWNSAHWLAMSSCMYNPFIYWWMSDKFRSGYVFIIRKIKYTCCRRGHDQLLLMNGRGVPFETSFSHVHEHQTHRQRLVTTTVDGSKCGAGGGLLGYMGPVGDRNGVKMGEAPADAYELRVMEQAVGKREEEGSKGKRKELTFHCDEGEDRRETVPLRKASDPAESGLGSEDGEELEDVAPASV